MELSALNRQHQRKRFFFLWGFCKLFPLELLTCGCFFRVLHPATEVRNIQEENARQPKMGIHQVIAVNVLWKTKTEICSQYWLSLFLTFSLDLSIRYENWCWQKLSTSVCYTSLNLFAFQFGWPRGCYILNFWIQWDDVFVLEISCKYTALINSYWS